MMRISQDYLRVYIAKTDALDDPAVYDSLYRKLPGFRRKKADSYKVIGARNQSVAAFCLLMYGLEKVLCTNETKSEHDKPDTGTFTPQDYEIRDLSIWAFENSQIVDTDIWNTLDYQTTETGKPYFAGRPDIHFSLSHTKGAVMCAISGSEVGCDIERIDRRMDLESVAARILTEKEIQSCRGKETLIPEIITKKEIRACRVEASDDQPAFNDIVADTNTDQQDGQMNRIQPLSGIDPKEFFRIWTRKEAYSKYTGHGLKQIADRIDLEKADAHIFSGETTTHIWSVTTEYIPKYG